MKSAYKFLGRVLGQDGFKAIRKAVERQPQLSEVLIPRAIVSWLEFTANHNYQGSIPGLDNSYVQFEKTEQGFNGVVALDAGNYTFSGASLHHLAAAVAVALDLQPNTIDPDVRASVLVKLGKSIDTLIKAQVVLEELKSPKALSLSRLGSYGDYHIEHGGESSDYSVVHTATQKPVETGIKSLAAAQSKARQINKTSQVEKNEEPGGAAKPKGQIPPQGPVTATFQQAAAKPPKALKPPKIPNMPVGKSEMTNPCPECGQALFQGYKFTGCVCLSEMAKSVSVSAYSDGVVLTFKPTAEPELAATLFEIFRR